MATNVVESLPSEQDEHKGGPDSPRRHGVLVRPAELACLLLIIALCDATIYNGNGFAGYALLFVVAPILLYFGVARRTTDVSARLLAPMLLILAGRLLWCGDWAATSAGFFLLAALAMSLSGLRPYMPELVVFIAQTIPSGFLALRQYKLSSTRNKLSSTRIRGPREQMSWLSIVIPGAAFFVFSLLFLLANPDLLSWVSEGFSHGMQAARDWLIEVVPTPLRILFWIAAAWIAAGLLRPMVGETAAILDDVDTATSRSEAAEQAPLYEAFRNMLVVVVALFGVYLAYEFTTVWSREFPPGSYSAYAHEGAFWLTVALAISTFLLSGIFQGRMLGDPRIDVLRQWSRVWAIENFLLAVAVYHRMFIYIDYNGMTRMRTVGLLGISAVVVGFILVLVKIAKGRSLSWLIRRDLWTLAFFIYLYVVLPVDMLVMGYNVRRIMQGDKKPSVQISVQPISAEGLLTLEPLLDAPDPLIRKGVGAILADERDALEARSGKQPHWAAYQIADERLREQLQALSGALAPYSDREARRIARETFDSYVYQWY